MNVISNELIPDLFVLPKDYRAFDDQVLPCSFSDRLASPVLRITRHDKAYIAQLGTYYNKTGQKMFVEALSLEHNWIFDGKRIKPLPYDTPEKVRLILGGASNVIRYPDVLRLLKEKHHQIDIIADSSVLEKANIRSEIMTLHAPVPGLQGTLYPYQEHGVAWLVEALETMGGAVLADEMGLGKTLQIIAVLLIKPSSYEHPALIVCPTTLIANWQREIHKFAPSLSILVHRGLDRTGYYKDLMRSDLVITTYDTLVNDLSAFRGVHWRYVICDEAQAVKNPNSKRRKAVSLLDRTYTLPVTGTPVENSLMDLWSLTDLAIPGVLGSKDNFEVLYPDTEIGAEDLSVFSDTVVLKRQVKDVANDLPERTDVDFPLELDPEGAKEYDRIRNETMEKYGRVGQLVAIGQLAIYCAHPWLRLKNNDLTCLEEAEVEINVDARYPLMTPKMELCINLLKEAIACNKKILIFAAYNVCGELIQKAALESGLAINYWNTINGATPQQKRQSIVDGFSAEQGSAVLILNPKAAGAGLNITAASVVIHYTQNWNPALEMQASARAHRRGQELPVTVYRLFYQDTVEQTMVERSLWKRELGEKAVPISVRDKEDLNMALSRKP